MALGQEPEVESLQVIPAEIAATQKREDISCYVLEGGLIVDILVADAVDLVKSVQLLASPVFGGIIKSLLSSLVLAVACQRLLELGEAMIAFSCSHCGMKLKVKPEFAGRQSKCPACKQPLAVPMPSATVAFVPPQQIEGEESSLAKAGLDGGVTLGQHETGKLGPTVGKSLAGRKNAKERYVIEGEIARGGMGAVLRAVDCDIRREVAVKYMLDGQDPKKQARFVEEAQITGQLEHPNIVPVHELGIDAPEAAVLHDEDGQGPQPQGRAGPTPGEAEASGEGMAAGPAAQHLRQHLQRLGLRPFAPASSIAT